MDREQVKRAEPKVPGYRIEGVLGRGATGTVYRARQVSVDREVALKVLHPELVGAKGAELRLQREARTTARLAHPHIISAFDMGEVDGMWWYAMELVDGVSLLERIRERPLNEREALRFFIPLVEALQHAFERGVVHRDVKPANILVERGGRALLVDLGLAFTEDDPALTKSGATLGTPHYISPEQARDPSSADTQSDLWSLGATLYHAVCGRPPFKGDSVAEILSAVLYEPVLDPREFAPSLSAGFVLVLRKCLTRDRSKRYATPAELLADLEKLRERRAPAVKRGALEPLARNRSRMLRIAASIALVSAVTLALVWLSMRSRNPKLGATEIADANAQHASDDGLATLSHALDGPAAGLSTALQSADFMLRTRPQTDPNFAQLTALRNDVERRLRLEEAQFRRESEAHIAQLLDERRFTDAELEAKSALAGGLRRRIGAGALPADLSNEFEEWVRQQSTRVASARAAAITSLGAALSAYFEAQIVPKVNENRARGAWRSARALLTTDSRTWIARVDAPRTGLTDAEVEEAIARFQTEKVSAAREQLDAAWAETDRELATAMEARLATLRENLEARSVIGAAARLRQGFATELDLRQTSLDEMPVGLLRLGYEALVKGEAELNALEQRLALEDARRGLSELDDDNVDAWKARRYADVARSFGAAATETWRAAVRTGIELRVREARALQDLLTRAAQNVTAREGERIELRVGSIVLAGIVSAARDPLRSGFVLTLDSGRVYSLALRPPEGPVPPGASPTILSADALLQFAGVAAATAPSVTPQDRLLRALFLMRDGDALGARSALDSGPLPRDEALVTDLEERLRTEFEHDQAAQGERRNTALERLRLIRRENQSGTRGEALEKRIEKLLRESSEVLSDEEIREVRRIRDERFAKTAPVGVEATVAFVFAPTALEELSPTRVRMRFDFNTAHVGAFDPGAWIPDGSGWSAVRYARSEEDLLSRPAPTLALKDPLRIQTDALDVRLKFEQLPDAPPDLVFVSCAGFQIAFTFTNDGARGHCFVDTSDSGSNAIQRARTGEGREFSGWKTGTPLEIRLAVARARGAVSVDVDGKRIGEFQKPVPRGDAAQAQLQIRSWEPIRLVSATIEAARRSP